MQIPPGEERLEGGKSSRDDPGAQFPGSTSRCGRRLPSSPASKLSPWPAGPTSRSAPGWRRRAAAELICRPEHSRAAPQGVGLSSDFGVVVMDIGHVATQWGHTTDLSHFGKLLLLSGGGRSVSGAPGLWRPRSSPPPVAPLAVLSTESTRKLARAPEL